jgi:hypothetical protein
MLVALAWLGACAVPAEPKVAPAGAALESGASLRGTSGRYRLQLSGEGWRLSQAEGADLFVVRGTGSDAAIAVRVLDKNTDLKEAIASRRQQLVDGGVKIDSTEERISLLAESDLVPLAFARYETTRQRGTFTYLLAVAELDDAMIEVFASSRSSLPGVDAEVEAIVRSLRIVSPRAPAAETSAR